MSSTVSGFFPIFVDESQMGKDEKDKMLGKNRADKINGIIKQCYNQLISKTEQEQLKKETAKQLIKQKSNRITSLKDVGFAEYHTLSFVLNTSDMKNGNIYPLFEIKKGMKINDDISFFGVNSQISPDKFLNNYGFFLYTTNDIKQQQQISFYAYSDLPPTSFGVFLNCLYKIEE